MTTSNQVSNAVSAEIQPFRIAVPQADLDDLQYNLLGSLIKSERAMEFSCSSNLNIASHLNNMNGWRIDGVVDGVVSS
jgi:hypothetical protein